MDTGEIIALIVVGALAGTAAATVMGWRKSGRKGSSLLRNTVIGILGAIVGGFVLGLLNVDPSGIFEASISLADLIVAFIGALIVIFVVGFLQN